MVAFFQMSGISAWLRERLKISVRYWVPDGPRCFRCRMERLSGPVAVEFLLTLMASVVFAGVKGERE